MNNEIKQELTDKELEELTGGNLTENCPAGRPHTKPTSIIMNVDSKLKGATCNVLGKEQRKEDTGIIMTFDE